MHRTFRSLTYAVAGIAHAWSQERNLRMFLAGFAAVLAIAAVLDIERWEWALLLISGGSFIAIELLNTAIERLTDAFDRMPKADGNAAFHAAMKATKDVGAGAALVSLLTCGIAMLLVLGPHASNAMI